MPLNPHHRSCDCVKRSGEPKRTYITQAEAQATIEYIRSRRGVGLRAYYCENARGWHLTSDVDRGGYGGGSWGHSGW